FQARENHAGFDLLAELQVVFENAAGNAKGERCVVHRFDAAGDRYRLLRGALFDRDRTHRADFGRGRLHLPLARGKERRKCECPQHGPGYATYRPDMIFPHGHGDPTLASRTRSALYPITGQRARLFDDDPNDRREAKIAIVHLLVDGGIRKSFLSMSRLPPRTCCRNLSAQAERRTDPFRGVATETWRRVAP